jgi:hypothetical protein
VSFVSGLVIWSGLLSAPAKAEDLKIHSSPHIPFSITICAILCPTLGPQGRLPQPLNGDPT